MAGTTKVKRKLFSVGIGDCKVETFSVGGAGGSGKDTSNTGVRITHQPSGAVGVGVDHRSQLRNKQDALRRLGESKRFRVWAIMRASDLLRGKTLDEFVDDMMKHENLRVEYQTEKGWKDER